MSNVNNDMDKVFRDKLGDFQQQPPEEIWVGIKAGIGGKPTRRILVPLWQVAAGAALLITAGSLYLFFIRPMDSQIAGNTNPVQQKIETGTPSVQADAREIISGNSQTNRSADQEKIESGKFRIHEEVQTAEIVVISEYTDLINDENRITDRDDNSTLYSGADCIPELMPVAYLQPVGKAIIPRKNVKYTNVKEILIIEDELYAEKEGKDDRLMLSAQVSPTFSYRDIGNPGSEVTRQLNTSESGKISYSGGLQFGYKTSGRLSIYAGVMYAQLAYNINQVGRFNVNKQAYETDILSSPESSVSVYSVRNSIGVLQSASRDSYVKGDNGTISSSIDFFGNLIGGEVPSEFVETGGKIEQSFQYLELPLLLRYNLFDRKFGINLLGGLSTNILMGNKATITTGNETFNLGSTGSVRDVNYMGNVGVGFDYELGKNLLFTVEPQFKYFLNSINENSNNLISNRPYMLGMFTGIKFIW